MRLSPPLVLLWICTAHALVTLQTIRDLTNTTNECRAHIVALGKVQEATPDPLVRALGGVSQVVVLDGEGGGDEEEVETQLMGSYETVTAALRLLCSDLLAELEKPLLSNTLPGPKGVDTTQCQTTVTEFHTFLEATVKFLHEVQERQMYWQWKSDSGVFDGVGWMQSLWASRGGNSQERSFIEQQMAVYSETGCFGKSKEVLRRDVEVVEYLNDLIDSFY